MTSSTRTRLNRDGLAALHARIRREVDDDLVSAAQLAIGHDGEIIEFSAFGTASTDDRFCIFSATKTLTATALLPHLADGTVDLTAPVARYVPEFGANGKHEVTVLQLLTMQGGFPRAMMSRKLWGTPEGRLQQIADWTLEYRAGAHTEYHALSAHWVIAALIDAAAGRSYVDLVHERVVAPAGARPLLGPAAYADRPPVTIRAIGEYPDDPTLHAVYGRPELVPLPALETAGFLALNDPRSWAASIPGGGGISSAHDMALIYQHLLHNNGGALPDDWLADATGTIRNVSVSLSDKVPANRTITGYMSGSDGFHDHRWMPDTPRAFGHAGAGGQLNFLDPDSGISFSFLHDTVNANPTVEFRRASDLHRLLLAALER